MMKTKRIQHLAALLLTAYGTCYATIPPGYYDQANGLRCQQLKTAMHMICGYANVLGYGGGEGKTWTGFYQTDRLEDGSVRDRYSYQQFSFSPMDTELAAGAVTGMNIEHSFPKSWWDGTENQAYKDLFNLMPSQSSINQSKSNYPMGVVTAPITDNGCTKIGKGEAGYTLWEPADEWKGDFARSYFYMVTMYSHLPWGGDQAPRLLQNDEWPTLQPWAYNLYLQWAEEDPVDDIERERNEAVYAIQGNRNPFIDFPSLAEYVWGDSTDYAFVIPEAETEANPEAYQGLVAFPATELLSSVYSTRFDANWSKFCTQGEEYQLDVYTRDNQGNRQSLEGYPRQTTATTVRVSEAKPSTTYYYTVSAPGNVTSGEIRVDMPRIAASFSVSPMQASFATVPGVEAQPVAFKVTLMATQEKVTCVSVEWPFQLSDTPDAMNWQQSLTLKGAEATFYVRMAAVDEECDLRGELLVSTAGMPDKRIPLLGTVDASKSFFEDFETGSKGSYAEGKAKCSASEWLMINALMGKDAAANDAVSVRIKGAGSIEMTNDKPAGCDSLWFYAGQYNKDTGMKLTVTYSTDSGSTWQPVVTDLPLSTWQKYGYKLDVQDAIRLRFLAVGATSKRINVDDIQMNDFRAPGDDEDGIMEMEDTRNEDLPIYNLTGRRLHTITQKGIYIIGTKKAIIN